METHLSSCLAVVLALLVGCSGRAEEGQAEVETEAEARATPVAETEPAAPNETEPAVEAEPEAPPETAPETEPETEPEAATETEPEGTGSPRVYTRISFDVRSMPHRGPYDVDQSAVTGRVQLLIERAREAAGTPEPHFEYQPGISTFRAEFFGSRARALAQCRRTVAEVAPPPPAGRPPSPRAMLREVEASPCQLIEDE